MADHRNSACVRMVYSICLSFAAWTVIADDGQPSSKRLSDEEVEQLIVQLGAPSFVDRESAANQLLKMGSAVRDNLMRARNSKSLEIRSRAASLLKQLENPPTAEELNEYAQLPDEKLNLEHGMWLIARIVNHDSQKTDMTKPLDELAEKVKLKLGKGNDPMTVDPQLAVHALREVLFDDFKLMGNTDDYENPENSSIIRVLATRKGLPITLSHVVVAVAERLEMPVVGVPTPGRYIVKYDGNRAPPGFPRNDIFLNPFDSGRILSRDDRAQLFPGLDPDDFPKPMDNRSILARMLMNLESHLFNREETDRAYQALQFRRALESSQRLQ